MTLKRHIGQKIALATAIFCGLLVLPVFGLFIWIWRLRGLADNWTPSALAAVGFLVCCSGVLYVTFKKSGVTCKYEYISKELWASFVNAPSKGKWCHAYIWNLPYLEV